MSFTIYLVRVERRSDFVIATFLVFKKLVKFCQLTLKAGFVVGLQRVN